jgi:hypothetical protein
VYEHHQQRPLNRREFIARVSQHGAIAAGLVLFSLALGMIGYRYFEDLGWTDSFLNSAMLLGGMGPVDAPKTEGGKLFAGCYALYAGLVFLLSASIIAAPVLHRLLHKLHWIEKRTG